MLETTTTKMGDIFLVEWARMRFAPREVDPDGFIRWVNSKGGEAIPPAWLDSTDYAVRRGLVRR